jgi:hypothetical protein
MVHNAKQSSESQLLVAMFGTCFHIGFLLSLFFYPKAGDSMFLQNVGWLSMDYMTLHPGR